MAKLSESSDGTAGSIALVDVSRSYVRRECSDSESEAVAAPDRCTGVFTREPVRNGRRVADEEVFSVLMDGFICGVGRRVRASGTGEEQDYGFLIDTHEHSSGGLMRRWCVMNGVGDGMGGLI